MEWISRIVNLANYFTTKEEFSHARNHLAAASKVLEFTEAEVFNCENAIPTAARCLQVEETAANVGEAWITYGLTLLAISVTPKELAHEWEDVSEEQEAKSENPSTEEVSKPEAEKEKEAEEVAKPNEEKDEAAEEVTELDVQEKKEDAEKVDVEEVKVYVEEVKVDVEEVKADDEKTEEVLKAGEDKDEDLAVTVEIEGGEVVEKQELEEKEIQPKGSGDEPQEVECVDKPAVEDGIVEEKRDIAEATEVVAAKDQTDEVEKTDEAESKDVKEVVKEEDVPKDQADEVEKTDEADSMDVKEEVKEENVPKDAAMESEDKTDEENKKQDLSKPSDEIDIDEYLKTIKSNPCYLFPTLDLSPYLLHVPCTPLSTPDQALFLYHFLRRWHARRVAFTPTQRDAGRYLTCVMQINEAARCAGMLQEDLDDKYKTLMDRVRMLELACQELTEDAPDFFDSVKGQLFKELADIQLQMMSINLKRIVTSSYEAE